MEKIKLSEEQQKLIDKMNYEGLTELVRLSGGFWCTDDTTMIKQGQFTSPEWSFGTLTIRALIKKEVLKPISFMKHGDPWKVSLNPEFQKSI